MVRFVTSVLALVGVFVFLSSFYFAFNFISSFVYSVADETRGVSFSVDPAYDISPYVFGDVVSIVPGLESPVAISSEGWGYDIENEKLLFSIEEKVKNILTGDACGSKSPIIIKTASEKSYFYANKLNLLNSGGLRPVGVSKKLVALTDDSDFSLVVASLSDEWKSKKMFFDEKLDLVCFYKDYLIVSLVSGDILKVSGDSKLLFLVGELGLNAMSYDDGLLTVDKNGTIKSINPPWELALAEEVVLTDFSFLPSVLSVITDSKELKLIERSTGDVLGTHKIKNYGKPVYLNDQLYLKHSDSLVSKVNISLGNERQWVQFLIELDQILKHCFKYLLQFLPLTLVFALLLYCYQVQIVRPFPVSLCLVLIALADAYVLSVVLLCTLPFIATLGLGRDLMSLNRFLCAVLVSTFFYFYFPFEGSSLGGGFFGGSQGICISFVFGYFVAQDLLLLSSDEREVSEQLGINSPVNFLRGNFVKHFSYTLISAIFIILAGGLVLRLVGVDRFLNYLEINDFFLLLYISILVLLRLPCIFSKKLNVAVV